MSIRGFLTREFIPLFGFLILYLFVLSNKKIESHNKKLLFGVIFSGIIELIAFEAELWTATLPYPTYLRIILSIIGYISRPILMVQLILMIDDSINNNKTKLILIAPCVLCILSVSTALFSKICFYYDANNYFYRGPLGYIPHTIGAFYFVVYAYLICRSSHENKYDAIIGISISLFSLLAMLIDLFLDHGGVTRIAIMLCTFFAYVQIQNKVYVSMIDDIPGAIAKFSIRNGKYKLTSFNEYLCQLLGMSYNQLLEATRDDPFSLLKENDQIEARKAMNSLQNNDVSSFKFELTIDGIDKTFYETLQVTKRTKNEITVYATMADITSQSKMLEELSVKNDEISLMMDQLGKIICVYDIPTRTLSISKEYAKLRGYHSNHVIVPDDAIKNNLIAQEYIDEYIEFYNKIFAGEKNGHTLLKFYDANGEDRYESTDFVNIFDDNNKPIRAVLSIEDVGESYRESLLLDSYKNTLNILAREKRLYALYDLKKRKLLVVEGGLLPKSEVALSYEEINDYMIKTFVKPEDVQIITEFLNPDIILSSYETGVSHRHIERVALYPNGKERRYRLTVNVDCVNSDNIVATIICEDIDDLYREQNDLYIRANYDSLTEVLAREATMDTIEDFLLNEGKDGNHALIMMDLDNLKQVNDMLGHQYGDTALKEFAKQVKAFFRSEDIVGRIGGDEFFVLVKNISGLVLDYKMKDLLHNLERTYSNGVNRASTSVSAGIAMYHGDASPVLSLKELYAQADAALYKSKALGKNTYVFSDELEVINTDSASSIIENNIISISMKRVLDNLASGIAIFHGDNNSMVAPLMCNEALPKLLGISYDDFSYHLSYDNMFAIHPDDYAQAKLVFYDAIETGESFRQTLRIKNGKGEYLSLTLFANVTHNIDGSYDLYCIFSNAQENERLEFINKSHQHHFEQMMLQVGEKKLAYILLNISQDVCLQLHEPDGRRLLVNDNPSASEVIKALEENIAIKKYRDEFNKKFNIKAFNKYVKEGVTFIDLRVPIFSDSKAIEWFSIKSEISYNVLSGDIEVFAIFENIDNKVRTEYTIDKLLEDEYEYICQIDVESGCMFRAGFSSEDGISHENNGKIKYDDILPKAIKTILPEQHQKKGIQLLSLQSAINELKQKKKYIVVFPTNSFDNKKERLCQWSFEYTNEYQTTILMCRKNISDFLNYGIDSLTGLFDRRGFYRKVRDVLLNNPNGKYFLAEIDIENFTLFNERKGYAEGNRFIRQFAADAYSKLNTKGDDCYIGHYEGDVFALLCSYSDIEKPEELFYDFSNQINTYSDIQLKLRMGVYTIENTSYDTETMCDCAHLALLNCKQNFNKKISYFSVDMKDKMHDEQLLVLEMQNAINEEQFEVWFQPQINHSNKDSLVGAEALVRWRHPTRGLVYPDKFIPVFESNGFIYELDKYVWRHTCAYIREWIDKGMKAVPISINVSRIDILNDDFIDTLNGIVNEYNIPVELLHLEITESAFSENTGKIIQTVDELINRGFIVAIDDFGSGYSSLSMLKNVHAHFLKLDMRFFNDVDNAARNECVIDSIIRMAKMLGMSVLSEGVEYTEQADFLRSVGCNYIQGYLFSKPLPYTEFVNYATKFIDEYSLDNSIDVIKDNSTIYSNSQELYRSIVFGSNDIVIVADIHTKQLLYANSVAEKFYGERFDPMKVTTCHDFCNHSSICKDCVVNTLKNDEKKEVFFKINGKKIKSLYYRIEWNRHDAFVAYQVDVTSEVNEQELTDNLIRNIPGAVIAFSVDENNVPDFTYVSKRTNKIFEMANINKDKFVYEDFVNITHPDDRDRIINATNNCFINKTNLHEKFRVVLNDNEIMWIDLIINPVLNKYKDYQFFGIFTNITEQMNVQERIDTIIQNIPSAIAVYSISDKGIRRIFISDNAKRILDVNDDTYDVIPFDTFYKNVYQEDRDRIKQTMKQNFEKRVSFSMRFRIVNQGTYRWVQLDSSPIVKSKEECYFYSVYTDITLEKQMQGNEADVKGIISTQDTVNVGLRQALLFDSPSKSIDYILAYIGKTLDCDRAYLFEKNSDGSDSNTYEWVNEGVSSEMDNLQNVSSEVTKHWYEWFKNEGVLVIENVEDIKTQNPILYETLAVQNIQSVVVAPFYDNFGEPMGFFGLDNPEKDMLMNYPALAQTIAFFIEAMLKRKRGGV